VVAKGLVIYSGINFIADNSDVLVYPVPAKNELFIELKNSTVGICDLYDAQGRIIKHIKLASENEILDISGYPAGNYIVRIITDNSIDFRKVSFIK
jgi:glucuronoarabinoxylan endo-1,4-beta-xylanase